MKKIKRNSKTIYIFLFKHSGKQPYITCLAIGNNICGPNIKDNIPEIYTIFSFEKNRVMVNAFSGKYCFAGYEGK